MQEAITIREWVSKWNAGEFAAKDFETQCKAGWYDWFCNDNSLAVRLVKFGEILAQVKSDFILDNYRVWFKNNCPVVGPLYDDMRFEPMDESLRDTHYFGIAVDDERRKAKYTVFTARKGYNDEFYFSNAREVVAFLNNWKV
ncbi:MAG: hypothetical protein PHS57_06290 [Alphaproteobacteria bacterium]|nr:hypothetical protein [Alphaproteobacteria bacterium]